MFQLGELSSVDGRHFPGDIGGPECAGELLYTRLRAMDAVVAIYR